MPTMDVIPMTMPRTVSAARSCCCGACPRHLQDFVEEGQRTAIPSSGLQSDRATRRASPGTTRRTIDDGRPKMPSITDHGSTAAGRGVNLLMPTATKKPRVVRHIPPHVKSVMDSVRICQRTSRFRAPSDCASRFRRVRHDHHQHDVHDDDAANHERKATTPIRIARCPTSPGGRGPERCPTSPREVVRFRRTKPACHAQRDRGIVHRDSTSSVGGHDRQSERLPAAEQALERAERNHGELVCDCPKIAPFFLWTPNTRNGPGDCDGLFERIQRAEQAVAASQPSNGNVALTVELACRHHRPTSMIVVWSSAYSWSLPESAGYPASPAGSWPPRCCWQSPSPLNTVAGLRIAAASSSVTLGFDAGATVPPRSWSARSEHENESAPTCEVMAPETTRSGPESAKPPRCGRHRDDVPQHRQKRSQFVRPDRREGDAGGLEELMHRAGTTAVELANAVGPSRHRHP